jgi:NADP-dependent 3-hydroxy acid dehydrogenase YdfG
MTSKLTATVALVTGASSGIGEATARRVADDGASVALVARRRDRLEALAAEIQQTGGSALVVEADITDRTHAEAAIQQTVERFGRLDILVNNAGLVLLGPVVGADPDEWDRMIAINAQGLLYTAHAALPYLLKAAEDDSRQVRSPTSSTSAPSPVGSRGTATASTT